MQWRWCAVRGSFGSGNAALCCCRLCVVVSRSIADLLYIQACVSGTLRRMLCGNGRYKESDAIIRIAAPAVLSTQLSGRLRPDASTNRSVHLQDIASSTGTGASAALMHPRHDRPGSSSRLAQREQGRVAHGHQDVSGDYRNQAGGRKNRTSRPASNHVAAADGSMRTHDGHDKPGHLGSGDVGVDDAPPSIHTVHTVSVPRAPDSNSANRGSKRNASGEDPLVSRKGQQGLHSMRPQSPLPLDGDDDDDGVPVQSSSSSDGGDLTHTAPVDNVTPQRD